MPHDTPPIAHTALLPIYDDHMRRAVAWAFLVHPHRATADHPQSKLSAGEDCATAALGHGLPERALKAAAAAAKADWASFSELVARCRRFDAIDKANDPWVELTKMLVANGWPDEGSWLVRFEEDGMDDVLFSGTGATTSAVAYFHQMALTYQVHLFRLVASL